MNFVSDYFREVSEIAKSIDIITVESMADSIANIRESGGRLFVLGVGGSAGNASHMVNDLRKLCCVEAYCPTDNVSELTARTNDEGFETVFKEFLRISKFSNKDGIFVLSVGGGNEEKKVSLGLIEAIKYANQQNGTVLSIVGRMDGYAANNSEHCLVIPVISTNRVTPHSESFQSVVWHCIVSHPILQKNYTKW